MWRGQWLIVGIVSLGCGGISERHGDPNAGGSSAGTGGSPTGGSAVVEAPPSDEPVACYNDSDCPNPACGGAVCNWTKTAPVPDGMKSFLCNPAGTQSRSMDGWCTTDADCKCRGLGAKCQAPFCTFTRPEDG